MSRQIGWEGILTNNNGSCYSLTYHMRYKINGFDITPVSSHFYSQYDAHISGICVRTKSVL